MLITTATAGKVNAAFTVYCGIATIDEVLFVGMEVSVKNGAMELEFDQLAVKTRAWIVAPWWDHFEYFATS